jgi:small subunit ribosomal protein S17
MEKTTAKKEKKLQILNGKVISSKNHCTIVAVSRLVKHPKYGKYIQYRKKYKAHDLKDTREVGEEVSIVASKPVSKDKRFRVL